jgi:hypothetical protein
MNTLTNKTGATQAQSITVTNEDLMVQLVDGRTISVPISWFPRLVHGTPEERNTWRLIGRGEGIHWAMLDEDINVEHLLEGHASEESLRSLTQWLRSRGTTTAKT